MSLRDYEASQAIDALRVPFDALIMAAMRKADSSNLTRLRAAWPELFDELKARYNAPGGLLEGDQP